MPDFHRKADRRRAPRVEVDVPARVFTSEGFHLAHCKNLSLTGLGLETFQPLPEGIPLRVEIDLPHDSVTLAADVVRPAVYPDGLLGLRLLDAAGPTLATLFLAMRRAATRPAEHHGYFADE